MPALKQLLLRGARHIPTDVLRRFGRWMLGGRRRRMARDHLFRMLGDAPRTIDRGVGAGIRISASASNLGYAMGVSEPAVQEELQRALRPGMVFYDVGANVGFLTLIAARLVGAAGRVVAFEPLAANVQLLERNLELNATGNVSVVARALSAAPGRLRMTVPESSDSGTQAFLDPAADANGPEVEVSTLDGVIDELGLRPPDLVKIDVEGAELDVVIGMSETLRTVSPRLLIEIHDHREDPRRETAIRDLLVPLGYRMERIGGESGGMPHLLAVPPSG